MVITEENIWRLLEEVVDPEIPVLTVVDLGIVRKVEVIDGKVIVSITPTYSGCPAMKTIETDIENILKEMGISHFEVKTILQPAWTTDWMSENGKMKLFQSGIAPPTGSSADKGMLMGRTRDVICPQCGSHETIMISQFGSTACKSLYKCNMCLEPFHYFKCL